MNNLRKYRKLRKMSQIELAHSVGLKWHSFISNCETGEKRLPYDLAVKIANVLDCDVFELMGDDIYRKGVAMNPDKLGVGSNPTSDLPKQEQPTKPKKPLSYKEASELVEKKFGVKLLKEVYNYLVSLWEERK